MLDRFCVYFSKPRISGLCFEISKRPFFVLDCARLIIFPAVCEIGLKKSRDLLVRYAIDAEALSQVFFQQLQSVGFARCPQAD